MQALPAGFGGGYYCPACNLAGRDSERREQQDREEREERERIGRLRLEKYLADSALGSRFVGMTFADYRPPNRDAAAVLETCRSFADTFTPGSGKSLVFVGSPGTGKNMLSAIIGQEVMRKGHSFLHTTAVKVVRRFKDSWKSGDVTEEEVLRYFVAPDLMVIDEVGVQFGTATEQLYLTEVINDRYEAKKSTILISNLTIQQVAEVLGVRPMDRFREDGSQVLVFAWPSWRRQQSSM
jgi:DNA replication protein DnaC